MIKIDVPMTKIAPFYYFSLGVTVLFIALHLLEEEVPYGIWSFVIPMIIAMILLFFDYSKASSIAREKVDGIVEKRKYTGSQKDGE